MRKIPIVSIALLAMLALALTACGNVTKAAQQQAHSTVAEASPRILAVYAGGLPGTAYATQALEWAKSADFSAVLNYSVIDATPAAIGSYMDLANQLGLKVIVSLSDLLGTQDGDPDPTDQALHQQFGATTDIEFRKIVQEFQGNPAVWGFSISDEEPDSPDGLSTWLPALQLRQAEIKKLTNKPTLVTLSWSGTGDSFYKSVASTTTDLAVDYYPFPENSIYGTVNSITAIGQALQVAAGSNSWFTLQSFGWGNGCHPEGAGLGFASDAPPPTSVDMVSMAKMAILGGARNVIMFSYDDNAVGGCDANSTGSQGQLTAMKTAAAQITGSDWWQ
jgi:hypothetical protein